MNPRPGCKKFATLRGLLLTNQEHTVQKIMVAIVDNVAKDLSGPITLFRHTQPAIRMFVDVMNYEQYKAHMEDFSLIQVGIFNEETMTIESTEQTEILSGKTLKTTLENQ